MPYTKKTQFSYNPEELYNLEGIESPKKCPMCHHAIEPVFISIAIHSESEGAIMFYCTACTKSFISHFHHYKPTFDHRYIFEGYKLHAPRFFEKVPFEKVIEQLSPRFVTTYNESSIAEQIDLKEVCGMGYRKALEILIKDYAIHKHPNDKDKISSPSYKLNQCINEYITEHRIKKPSIAASWIGNDETHYTRIHETKDIKDLKDFIKTVVYFIQFELSASSASDFLEKE